MLAASFLDSHFSWVSAAFSKAFPAECPFFVSGTHLQLGYIAQQLLHIDNLSRPKKSLLFHSEVLLFFLPVDENVYLTLIEIANLFVKMNNGNQNIVIVSTVCWIDMTGIFDSEMSNCSTIN